MNGHQIRVQGFQLQESPPVLCGMLPGNWLLQHSTPSWRIQDPIRGFQRIVRERRAREIALAVLDQQRTFPNSIILATDIDTLETRSGMNYDPRGYCVLGGRWAASVVGTKIFRRSKLPTLA